MPKIDIDAVARRAQSDYPAPFNAPVAGCIIRNVARQAGATDFVANHVVLPAGSWSSQRHWHEGEDEIVVILSGEATLIDDAGRHPMRAGDIAVFAKNDGNGHHLANESDADCVLLALSPPEASVVNYPDIDLRWSPADGVTHKDGTPY
jgi:uncharacterized cupin superfamily protein